MGTSEPKGNCVDVRCRRCSGSGEVLGTSFVSPSCGSNPSELVECPVCKGTGKTATDIEVSGQCHMTDSRNHL